MKFLFLILSVFICNIVVGQRSSFFEYYFRVFAPGYKNEITRIDTNFKITSLLFFGEQRKEVTLDRCLSFGNFRKEDGVDKWQIIEPDEIWRNFVCIQIIKVDTKDTMTVVNDTYDGTKWNDIRVRGTVDTIFFKKGNYEIINYPYITGSKYSKEIKPITYVELTEFISKKKQG